MIMKRLRRISSMFILACLLVLRPDIDLSAQRLPVPASPELHRRITEHGSISVIVKLDFAYTPVSELSPEQARLQRKSLKAFRRDLLSKLEGKGVLLQGHSDRWMIPFMALRVNRKGLRALESQPGVIEIVEDRPSSPSLLDVLGVTDTYEPHNLGFTGLDQVIAVLDSGINVSHPMLAEQVVGEVCYSETYLPEGLHSLCGNGSNFQSGLGAASNKRCKGNPVCGHGNYMTGFIAGAPYTWNNNTYKGMAYGAKIFAAQVYTRSTNDSICGARPGDGCILTYTSYQTDALQYIYDNRGKFNLAAVVLGYNGDINTVSGVCNDDPRNKLVDALFAVGIATIVPAGNDGNATKVAAPGCIPNAITVGATDNLGIMQSWSNSSEMIDLVAPGKMLTSAGPGTQLMTQSGTSAAAAQVAGAWAILKQVRPNAEVNVILHALQETGRWVDDTRNGLTHRFIRVGEAVKFLQSLPKVTNLITNSDFESGTGITATGWTQEGTGASWICGVGNPLVYSGTCSAQLVSNGQKAVFQQVLVQSATSTNYAWLSARINRHGARGTILATLVGSDGRRLKLKLPVSGTGTYRLFTNTVPLESGTYTITVEIRINATAGGSFEVDDLQLTFQDASATIPWY